MTRYMRESKYGGISECKSPSEKVGVGRCHHILGSEQPPVMEYSKEDKCNYVDLGTERDEPKESKQKEENIKATITSIHNNLEKDEIDKVLSKIS